MYGMQLSGKKLVTQSCSFCDKIGHTEAMCHIKAKAQTSAKKNAKDNNIQWKKEKAEKAQYFSAAASSQKDDKSDEDDFDKKRFYDKFY
jgi:radical SAM superfamily enzyme